MPAQTFNNVSGAGAGVLPVSGRIYHQGPPQEAGPTGLQLTTFGAPVMTVVYPPMTGFQLSIQFGAPAITQYDPNAPPPNQTPPLSQPTTENPGEPDSGSQGVAQEAGGGRPGIVYVDVDV